MSSVDEAEARAFDVLILGGGFAGIAVGQALRSRARKKKLRVGIVAAENYMVFQPMLAEVAASSISPQHVVNPIRLLCAGCAVFRGEVTRIDPATRTVHVKAGFFTPDVALRTDQLVLGMGAVVDLKRVPGMSEHALLMQTVGDAMKLRAKILERFEEANLIFDREKRRRLLRFVVVGGGYSGVETAGEVLDLMAGMQRWYPQVGPEDYEVVLVHSGPVLLPTLGERLGEYAGRKLAERGLRLVLESRVKVVTAHYVMLDTGEAIETSTVISTVGNAPNPVVSQLCESLGLKTERGRIEVGPDLRVPGCEWLWAAGDCAMVPKNDGGYCPATAQFAMRQGTRLGRNLIANFAGRPPQPFTFTGLGELAAIGHRTAVAEISGLRFSGFIAWWMWRTIYLSKLPGFQTKLRVLVDWTFDLFFPRDINLLNPRFSNPLREIRLEPGDVLFNPGEPAISLYFVQSGQMEIRDAGGALIKKVPGGEYFGERALLEDRIWRFRAVAVEPSTLIALAAPEFHAIVKGSSALRTLFKRSAQAYASTDQMSEIKRQLQDHTLGKTAAELMNRSVDHLRIDMTLTDAMRLFREHRHGSYPLLDLDGKVLGVVKRDDLYDRIKQGGIEGRATVAELPVTELPVLPEATPALVLIDVMTRSGRNKILMVDPEGHLTGLVTIMDLLEDSLMPASAAADVSNPSAPPDEPSA